MKCPRCQGLMAEDHFLDLQGTGGWMKGWRCLNCGHAHDSLIGANRRLYAATMLARPHEEPEYEGEDVHLGAETIIGYAA